MPKKKAYWIKFEHGRSYPGKTWQLVALETGAMLAKVYTFSGDGWLAKIGDHTNSRRMKFGVGTHLETNACWSRIAEAKRHVKDELGVSITSVPVDPNY